MRTATNQVAPKLLVVSREAAAIAQGYDRLVAALDVPVDALRRLCSSAEKAGQAFKAFRAAEIRRREHVRLQGRIWTNVLKRVDGVR